VIWRFIINYRKHDKRDNGGRCNYGRDSGNKRQCRFVVHKSAGEQQSRILADPASISGEWMG